MAGEPKPPGSELASSSAPLKRGARASANEAAEREAPALSPRALRDLAAAQRDRPQRPMGPREQTDAVSALLAGAGVRDSGEPAGRADRGSGRGEARPEEAAGDDGGDGERDAKRHGAGDDDERGREDDERDARDDDEQDDDHGADDTVTLESLARQAGLTKAELNAIEVRVGHETLTLGELKGKLPALAKLDHDRAEFDERKEANELELIDGRRRLMALVESLPAHAIPPAVWQRLDADHARTRDREQGLLLSARPQWKDEGYRTQEKAGMLKLAQRYGFTRTDLETVIDHRQLLLLQDFAHTLARLESARAAARRVDSSDAVVKPEAARAPPGAAQRATVRGPAKQAALATQVSRLIGRG